MTSFIAAPVSTFPELHQGELITCLMSKMVLPLVDPHDIGAFEVAAFEDLERFGAKVVSV